MKKNEGGYYALKSCCAQGFFTLLYVVCRLLKAFNTCIKIASEIDSLQRDVVDIDTHAALRFVRARRDQALLWGKKCSLICLSEVRLIGDLSFSLGNRFIGPARGRVNPPMVRRTIAGRPNPHRPARHRATAAADGGGKRGKSENFG